MSYVNPFHYALTALLFFAAVFFAAASAGETNLYDGLIVPPIAWSTPPKPPKTGDFKDDLKHPTTNAFITRYRLFVPEKLPKKRHLALLICFHGRGGNEDGPAELMNRTIKDLGLSDQYIVMGLKSHESGWEDADEIDVLKAYDWVSSVYPIDLRRVYLIGHSSGAHWDTHFGSKHIDLFAGIMRWAGGSIRPLGGKDAALQTEFYFVHGTKDDQNAIGSSREGRDHLKRAGCRYVFREVLTGDHGNILSMAPITHDLVWWMNSLRHKTMPLPIDDDKFLKQFATAKLRDKLLPQAETWNELLRIGGPQAGQVVAEAMTSPTAKIREFAALACTKGRFGGEETVAELAKLVDDKSAAVRTATIAALGVEANWRSETAQRALGELALSKKKVELTDRGDATIQLAKAATLPLLGNYDDDTPLWQALIGLLNDERKEIRTAAFSPLKIAVPDGNGYDPTATGPERAAAIAKWQAWLTAHQLSEENKAAK